MLGGFFVRTSRDDGISARFWHRLVMNDIDGTPAACGIPQTLLSATKTMILPSQT
jgi:hypothetical protein